MEIFDEYRGEQGGAILLKNLTYKNPEPAWQAHICSFFCHLPNWNPVWKCYRLSVVSLRDIEGVVKAYKQYPEAEYEMLVAALDPGANPKADDAETWKMLHPFNHLVQFHGINDDQTRKVCALTANALVCGELVPEPQGFLQHGMSAREWFEKWVRGAVLHVKDGTL